MAIIIKPPARRAVVGTAGTQGPRGPDGWAAPIQRLVADAADLTINYALGKHVVVSLEANVSSFSVVGWPAADRLARLTLEITNAGGFSIAWPAWIEWAYGVVPVVSPGAGAFDMIALTTVDGGPPVRGHVVGQRYAAGA
jgi:hypothetical protein